MMMLSTFSKGVVFFRKMSIWVICPFLNWVFWLFCLFVFSSRSIVVSGLMLKSSMHFELIFMHGVRYRSDFIILHVAVQFSQYCLLKRLSFSHCVFLVPLSKIGWPYMFRFISALSILFQWSRDLFLCQVSLFLIAVEKNTFTELLVAYHLLKALSIHSSKDTMPGTAAATRLLLGWACSSYSHPSESSQFLQGTDW